MKPECSLSHSQILAIFPNPEPAWSILHRTSHSLKIHLNIILSSRPGSPKLFFPQVSPPKPCLRLSSPPYALHAPPISFLQMSLWVTMPNFVAVRLAMRQIRSDSLYFFFSFFVNGSLQSTFLPAERTVCGSGCVFSCHTVGCEAFNKDWFRFSDVVAQPQPHHANHYVNQGF